MRRRQLTFRDRLGLIFAPSSTLKTIARRNYEAARQGRRTAGWSRTRGDVNALVRRAGAELRMHARDLVRNNAWARRGVDVIVHNTVGWGPLPAPEHSSEAVNNEALQLWSEWSESTDCDGDLMVNFAGLLQAIMRAVVVDGEVLVRRRWRRLTDGYSVPLQLQVLEIEHLDTDKAGTVGRGGFIVQGVEFDALGQRVAYWLFDQHPGGETRASSVSRRVPARDVLHVGRAERPGQVRFVTWFASVITTLKDLDSFEDGELQRQAVAASFAAFVTDPNGSAEPLAGEENTLKFSDGSIAESIEPGSIINLPIGKEVTFPALPASAPETFAVRNLRRIAAGLGLTYEDLVGDYSNVNFSSGRMGRIVHGANVRSWQNAMLEPQALRPIWGWFVEAAAWAGRLPEQLPAGWTHPPLPMLDVDKEVAAAVKQVRAGLLSPDDMVREQGGNPRRHWKAYADSFKLLDQHGITIDGDARKLSAAGQAQSVGGKPSGSAPAPADDGDDDSGDDDSAEPAQN